MFRSGSRILLDDGRRGDDRVFHTLEHIGQKPPVLRRSTLNFLGLCCATVIIYGTLIPFDLDWHRALRWNLEWTGLRPGDAVANVILYVPIGAFARLLFRRRGTSWLWECSAAIISICTLSYVTEVAQCLSPSRVSTLTDWICNCGGAMAGVFAAPWIQRMLRNVHAWGFVSLRRQPFTTAAAAATILIFIYGLAPFDPKPTIAHLQQALTDLVNAESVLPFGGGLGGDSDLEAPEIVDKVMDASAYSLLSILLILGGREAGRSIRSACWYGLSRSAVMALAIEAVQLFTMSHRSDPADLTGGWICAFAACVMMYGALSVMPMLHRHPFVVFHFLVAGGTVVILIGKVAMVLLDKNAIGVAEVTLWPMVANFHRTWNAVLGEYAQVFLQCGIVAGMIVAWARSYQRRPWSALVVMGCVALTAMSLGVSVYLGRPTDTAHLLLALVAGFLALRLDRAFFEPVPQPASLAQGDALITGQRRSSVRG